MLKKKSVQKTLTGHVPESKPSRDNEKLLKFYEAGNKVFSKVSTELLAEQDIQKAIDNICHVVMEFLECDFFFNFLVIPGKNQLQLNACHGISKKEADSIRILDFGTAVCGCVAQEGKRIIAEHIQSSDDELTSLIKTYGIRSYCCHPLKNADDVIGTLSFGATNRDIWSSEEVDMMENISGLISVAIQRKRLEENIIKNRQDLELAQSIGNIGNWRLNLDKNKLIWSAQLYRIFGVPEGSPQNYESFLSMVHPDDREFVDRKWKEALHGGDYDLEHRILNKGEIKWIREKATLEFDDSGNLVAGFGISQDITAKKISENELETARRKLELALENANIGQWEYDTLTGRAKMDERSERMFGLGPATFEGTMAAFENLVHIEDIDHLRKAISNALKNNVPYETIFRTRPLAGRFRYISAKAFKYKDEEGNVILHGVNFDITELKEGTQQLISNLNRDLLRSNNDLQQFAYVASHDLQEPLRMVSSFTQLLQMQYGDKLDENAREYIKFAVDGAKRMYELINAMLSFSRVQSKASAFTEVNMDSVVERVLLNLRLLVSETNAQVTADKLPVIRADENQMLQLIQNLVENGIKFNRGTPVVHISSDIDNGNYVFSVKDEGIGIDAQYKEKVFRIFQKLHTIDQYKGTGVGLAICKKIVERHGGEIWFESEPGMGSEFFFTIPQ